MHMWQQKLIEARWLSSGHRTRDPCRSTSVRDDGVSTYHQRTIDTNNLEAHMRTIYRTLTLAVFILTLSGTASAGTISTGSLEVRTGDDAYCDITNVGPTPVTFINPTNIFDPGDSGTACCSSCGATLPAGVQCFSLTHVAADSALRCTVSVQGSAKNIRAVLQIIDSSGARVSTAEAR